MFDLIWFNVVIMLHMRQVELLEYTDQLENHTRSTSKHVTSLSYRQPLYKWQISNKTKKNQFIHVTMLQL